MPFIFKLATNFLFELMVNYAKEDLKFLNSFIRPRAIRMHFDSHSELDLCPTCRVVEKNLMTFIFSYLGDRDLACEQARSQYPGKLFVSYERNM